jgi:hypothetical protein
VIALMLAWIVAAHFAAMVATGIWLGLTSREAASDRRRSLALLKGHPYIRGTNYLATLAAVALAVLTLAGRA